MVLYIVIGLLIGIVGTGYYGARLVESKEGKINKFKGYYNMLDQWLIHKQSGKNLCTYFSEHNYKVIAIYGMGEMGNRLYDELRGSEIEVKYVVDTHAMETYSEMDVMKPDEIFEPVDVIVVTAPFAFKEISTKIRERTSIPIISLEDVVFDL